MQGPGPGLNGLHSGSSPVVTDWPVRFLKGALLLKQTQNSRPSSPEPVVPSLAGKTSVAVTVAVPEVKVFVSCTSLGACRNPSPLHVKAAAPEFGKVETST